MSLNRRHFTREYKIEAVRLAAEKGRTTRAAARQLGIPENHIYRPVPSV